MSEKQPTLLEVGGESARIYGLHKAIEDEKVETDNRFKDLEASGIRIDSFRLESTKKQHSESLKKLGEQSDAVDEEGRAHFEANSGAYHDLGVIEAHMAGIAIAVDKPVVIGTSVERSKEEEPRA